MTFSAHTPRDSQIICIPDLSCLPAGYLHSHIPLAPQTRRVQSRAHHLPAKWAPNPNEIIACPLVLAGRLGFTIGSALSSSSCIQFLAILAPRVSGILSFLSIYVSTPGSPLHPPHAPRSPPGQVGGHSFPPLVLLPGQEASSGGCLL